MTVKVKEIEDRNTYHIKRMYEFRDSVIEFLRKNTGTAFTSKEIVNKVNTDGVLDVSREFYVLSYTNKIRTIHDLETKICYYYHDKSWRPAKKLKQKVK